MSKRKKLESLWQMCALVYKLRILISCFENWENTHVHIKGEALKRQLEQFQIYHGAYILLAGWEGDLFRDNIIDTT